MPGLLSVTDDGLLSEPTRKAIDATFLPRDEYDPGSSGGTGSGVEALPSHFAGVRKHSWVSPVYNPGAPGVALIRGGIAAVEHAGVGYEIVMLGDSKLEGYNAGGSGVRWRYGWAGQLRAMLGGVEGTVLAYPGGIDARWSSTMIQGNTNVPGLVKDGTNVPSTTFTFDTPHTGGTFWVRSVAGGNVTVKVDGGTTQTFTVAAGNGFKAVTPTVTGTGTHTYVIAGDPIDHLYGFRPTYSGAKLRITNLGRSGATAAGWLPGVSATQSGHWDGLLAATTPDAIVGALGTNQPGNDGPANAANLTSFWAAVVGLSKPTIIVTPGGLDLNGAESFTEQYRAQLVAADTHNLMLTDFASVIGTGAEAQARGLMADSTHENRRGFTYEAATVLAVLGLSDRLLAART